MEIHPVSAVREAGKAYAEFLRKPSFSAGIYRLPAGGADNQSPHTEDEIYYVVAGASRFSSGDRDVAVRSGDVIFVPALEPHKFYGITADLELLVFFAPAEGSNR